MDGFHHHGNAARLERVVERAGDLRGEPLLDLKPLGEHVDEPRDLREADDLLVRHVRHVTLADEYQQMMLTQTREVDVFDDDHLVVILDEERAVEHVFDFLVVTRRQIAQGRFDALGRLDETLTIDVLAQLLQDLFDVLADHPSSPRYSNRFFAVSTTVTRESRPVGSPAASVRQKARARLSPVVMTPASAGASSSFA